jgi:hypothetical protein
LYDAVNVSVVDVAPAAILIEVTHAFPGLSVAHAFVSVIEEAAPGVNATGFPEESTSSTENVALPLLFRPDTEQAGFVGVELAPVMAQVFATGI